MGEADAKVFLNDIYNLQGDTLSNNASNFCRQIINWMKSLGLSTKSIRPSTEHIRKSHGLMTEDENDVLAGE